MALKDDLIFRTEQQMLPEPKRSCTRCKGRGEVIAIDPSHKLTTRYIECRGCGGTGKWEDQQSESWACAQCGIQCATLLELWEHETKCLKNPPTTLSDALKMVKGLG